MKYNQVLELTKNVNALLCEKDKRALYDYASKVRDNGVIVDIGTAAGGSAFITGLASKANVKVYTIDPNVNRDFNDSRKLFGLERKVTFVNKTSSEAFSQWNFEPFLGAKIDMLFIDGVHNYQGVMDDFNTFGSLVRKGGTIVFHDIFLYENTIGAAVKEIVDKKLVKVARVVKDHWTDDRLIGMMVSIKT